MENEREKRKAKEIPDIAVGFVTVSLICELFTAITICAWMAKGGVSGENKREDISTIVILFLADVGFSVGKLFPGVTYHCDSWSCRKVTHVCTMTLCAFLFQLYELLLLRIMSRDQGIRAPVLVKLVEYSASLAFVLYDAVTQDPPGVGTTVLIVCASLAEILLLAIEAHTFWTFRRPEDAVGPLLAQVQLGKYDKVQRLLQNGADVNAANSCTPPPLGLQPARAPMCSLCSCRQTCVRVCTDARTPALCSRGAGADHRDQEGAPGPG
jgi:hypothetical protein